jgi:hypothetical protein
MIPVHLKVLERLHAYYLSMKEEQFEAQQVCIKTSIVGFNTVSNSLPAHTYS